MTYKEFSFIKARIKEEIANINALLAELERQKRKDGSHQSDDSFSIRAIGSILQDYYVMVENILKIIGGEIDESLPQGQDGPRQLLKQMTLDVSQIRRAVLTKDTMQKLDKYRAFRQVFRHVYGYNLDSKRIIELVEELPETVVSLETDLENFINHLEEIMA